MQERSRCEQVLSQLDQILESEHFRKSNRLGRFLSYVVRQTLNGDPKTIRSYNIAVEVFGKGADFDPGDPYVRNIARLTRQALDNFYKDPGGNRGIRIDVPAGNYVATFTPISVIADATFQPPAPKNAPLKKVAGLSPTIAVIPLLYMGAHTDKEAVVGEILASGVIAGLSKSSHLNVISWLSTTKFRNTNWDIETVSGSLNCDYVLSGSYRCTAGKLSIFLEIADGASQEVIWAEMVRSTVDELISADASVVADVTSHTARVVLNQEIRRASSEPIESLSLHTKLIAGLHYLHSISDQRFNLVKTSFDQILEIYPKHATVNALLAQWYVLKINRSGGWQSSGAGDVNKERAITHLQSALEENPCHPLALTMSGLVETQFGRNPEKGLQLYDSAEHYNPNEPILMAYKAAALSYKGEADIAIEYAEKALALSPFDPQLSLFHTCAAAAHYSAGDYESAEHHADRAFDINPVHTSNLRTLVAIQIDLGKVSEAQSNARRLLSLDPGFTTGSYLKRSPNASYQAGRTIADRLERAGIPYA